MPSHYEPSIGEAAQSAEEQMTALEKRLMADLDAGYVQALGIHIPPADQADVRIVDVAARYHHRITIDEFKDGAWKIVAAVFGRKSDLTQKVLTVAEVAIRKVIIDGSNVAVGVQGDSAKIEANGKTYVAACYTSTASCSKKDWGTEESFYVATFAFTVFTTAGHPAHAFNSLRTQR